MYEELTTTAGSGSAGDIVAALTRLGANGSTRLNGRTVLDLRLERLLLGRHGSTERANV